MKREYKKPIVVFENFCMSTNIAANCDRIVNNPTQYVCGIPGSAPGMDVFSTGIHGCVIHEETVDGVADGVYDGYCYHVPDGQTQLFNS